MSDPSVPSDDESDGASGEGVPSSPRRLIDGPVCESHGDVAKDIIAFGPFFSGPLALQRATKVGAIAKALMAHPHRARRKEAGPIGTALMKRGLSGGALHAFAFTREVPPDSEDLVPSDGQVAGATLQRSTTGSFLSETATLSPGTAPTRRDRADGTNAEPDAVIADDHARPRAVASAAIRAPDAGPQDWPWARSAATFQDAAEIGTGSVPQAELCSPERRDSRVNCDVPTAAGQWEADKTDDVVPVFLRRGGGFSRETPTAQYAETSHAIPETVGAGRKTRGAAPPPHSMQEGDAGAHRSVASDRPLPGASAPLEKTAPTGIGMMSSTTKGRPDTLCSAQRENTGISIALDEDTLRQVVSETVRAQLQGTVGVRVSRNLRKMVRREVRLVLGVDEED
jgi:hypothetical protein